MARALTARQKQALKIIEDSISDQGYAPTLSEMMEEMGVTTKKGVAFHLDALEKKGYIIRSGEARGIRLVSDESGEYLRVPLLGFANAGEPLIDAKEEFLGELTIDKKLLERQRRLFGVELRGDSMDKRKVNGVKMDNGNYAIVSRDSDFRNGDVVLAVINDGATVKIFKKEKGMTVLYPDSSNEVHRPIYIKQGEGAVVGKVVTVLHNPKN